MRIFGNFFFCGVYFEDVSGLKRILKCYYCTVQGYFECLHTFAGFVYLENDTPVLYNISGNKKSKFRISCILLVGLNIYIFFLPVGGKTCQHKGDGGFVECNIVDTYFIGTDNLQRVGFSLVFPYKHPTMRKVFFYIVDFLMEVLDGVSLYYKRKIKYILLVLYARNLSTVTVRVKIALYFSFWGVVEIVLDEEISSYIAFVYFILKIVIHPIGTQKGILRSRKIRETTPVLYILRLDNWRSIERFGIEWHI